MPGNCEESWWRHLRLDCGGGTTSGWRTVPHNLPSLHSSEIISRSQWNFLASCEALYTVFGADLLPVVIPAITGELFWVRKLVVHLNEAVNASVLLDCVRRIILVHNWLEISDWEPQNLNAPILSRSRVECQSLYSSWSPMCVGNQPI